MARVLPIMDFFVQAMTQQHLVIPRKSTPAQLTLLAVTWEGRTESYTTLMTITSQEHWPSERVDLIVRSQEASMAAHRVQHRQGSTNENVSESQELQAQTLIKENS